MIRTYFYYHSPLLPQLNQASLRSQRRITRQTINPHTPLNAITNNHRRTPHRTRKLNIIKRDIRADGIRRADQPRHLTTILATATACEIVEGDVRPEKGVSNVPFGVVLDFHLQDSDIS